MRCEAWPCWSDLLFGFGATAVMGFFWLGCISASTEDVLDLIARAHLSKQSDVRIQALLQVNPAPSHGELIEMRRSVEEALRPAGPVEAKAFRFLHGAKAWLYFYWPLLTMFLVLSVILSFGVNGWRRSRAGLA